MKRIVCVILTILLCVGMFPLSVFAEGEILYTTTVDVVSTEYSNDTCRVYIHDDDCYMYIDDVVRYTRSAFSVEDGILTVTHGTREMKISLANSELEEDGVAVEMKTLHNGDKVIVHAFPMLTYLGATCSVDKGKLVINMPESTIWEGLSRIDNEFYISNEMFGDKTEQKFRLLLNSILTLFESGIGGLFANAVQDAFVVALQVDALDYSGAWEIKNANNKKIEALVTQEVAKGNLSDNISEWLSEGAETVMSNIALDWIRNVLVSKNGTERFDAELISCLDTSKAFSASTAGALSFLSILSSNKKCTEDSAEMLRALANNLPASSNYRTVISGLYMETKSEITAQIDAGFQAATQTILSQGVDSCLEQIIDKTGSYAGVESYVSLSGLIKASLDISVIINKMLMRSSGEDAFAYSSAETSVIYLLCLRSEVIKAMETLADKIHDTNYRDAEAIEDWRLINALYYKIQIAINQKTEEMIVAQGRQNDADMAPVIEQLHANSEAFAKNLYILTTATGTAFPDVKKISNSNQWDEDSSIKKNAEEVPNGIAGLGAPSMKLILSGIEADSIQYYKCAESGNFAVIGKDGKYGIIGYDGKILLPIEYDEICQGCGAEREYIWVIKGDSHYSVDKNVQLMEFWGFGGDVDPEAYWYNGKLVVFLEGTGILGGLEELSCVMIDQTPWEKNAVLPVQEMRGIEHSAWGSMPKVDNTNYALVDTTTGKLVSDFVYSDFDTSNGFREGVLAIKKGDKWGFIDAQGNELTEFVYDPYAQYDIYEALEYSYYIFSAANGYIAVLRNGKWGLIDLQGNTVVDTAYDGISQVNPDGMFWLKENGTWSLYQLEK